MNQEIMSWDNITMITTNLGRTLPKTKFDYIIAIANGGLIPARLLKNFINCDKIITIGIKHYKDKDKLRSITIWNPIDKNKLKQKRVVIIDDICDSGDTLKYCINYCKPYVKSFTTVTLLYKKIAVVKPDYYGAETDKWIVFPWERNLSIK